MSTTGGGQQPQGAKPACREDAVRSIRHLCASVAASRCEMGAFAVGSWCAPVAKVSDNGQRALCFLDCRPGVNNEVSRDFCYICLPSAAGATGRLAVRVVKADPCPSLPLLSCALLQALSMLQGFTGVH